MHNIDRTLSMETGDFEAGDFEADGLGYEADFEGDLEADLMGETAEVGALSEEEEIDLAAELLTIGSDQELDQFLGSRFFGRLGGGLKRFAQSQVGRKIGGMLKGVAKRALPMVGGAVGSFLAPGVGTAAGTALGRWASNLFEVDLEGLNDEDAQFEVARRYVRLADAAVRQGARMMNAPDPRQAARAALATAARRHAPGLARALTGTGAATGNGAAASAKAGTSTGARMTGRWVRRGSKIVLFGV